MPESTVKPLKVAVIGAGPGGLGVAIALSALPNIEVAIYEQARELREVGAGISVNLNTWRVLKLLGADGALTNGHPTGEVQNRDGKTGEILSSRSPINVAGLPRAVRAQRTALQSALLSRIPKGTIQLSKRLKAIKNLGTDEIDLTFEDGAKVTAHLVVGADGIRSVVREAVFPRHSIKFTGTTIWRALLPLSAIPQHLSEFVKATSWWHGPDGHFYFSEVGEGKWEIAARAWTDPATTSVGKVSWGVPVSNEKVESFFTEYHPFVREALKLVPQGGWKEFCAFAGPELNRLIGWNNKVVLVGDASHPLSGAFGSGAGFALEDGYILAQAIQHSRRAGSTTVVPDALVLFDEIRSPYYARMYDVLALAKAKTTATRAQEDQSWHALVKSKVKPEEGKSMAWIYDHDIELDWVNAVAKRALQL